MNSQSQTAQTTTPNLRNWPGAAPLERIAAAFTAVTVTTAIGAALLLSFADASPTEWLASTPAVLAEVLRCEQLAGRNQQTTCKQQFVTAQLSKSPTAFQVAGR